MSFKDRVEHANVFKAAIETLSIKTNIARRSAGLKSERERERETVQKVYVRYHAVRRIAQKNGVRRPCGGCALNDLICQSTLFLYISKKITRALIVTRLPLGFFSKSSRSTFSPTISTAEGKFSLKKAAADSRVVSSSREEKGINKVRVNEPS